MRRTLTTEAIVLSATDVGEEDRILTFLTPGMGLLRAAASSARSLKKGRAAPLDLFVHTRLTVSLPGKEGKLKRVGSTDLVEPYMGIRRDYGRLCAASYMGQTVAHCIQEDDPSPGIWELVLHCLAGLDAGTPPYRLLLLFEVKLLRELGLLPVLGRCFRCGEEVSAGAYLDPDGGGVAHRTCSVREHEDHLSAGDLAALRYVAGRDLTSASKLSVKEEDARRLFNVVHAFAVHHLGYESRALGMIK